MSGRTQFSTIKKSNKKDFYKNDVDKILVKKKNHKQKKLFKYYTGSNDDDDKITYFPK